MSREILISELDRPGSDPWDIAIIGGGAVGMGAALDAVSRGHSCVLLEQHDFGKGTSSRSTKLIHGGVRYLAQGNLPLVREALCERGLLLRNAPSLVQPLRFVIPCYSGWERWYYWLGMKCYDALAGRMGIQPSRHLSAAEFARSFPGVQCDGIKGAVAYYDAQFNDSRLIVAIAKKLRAMQGLPLNYMRVTDLTKKGGRVSGLKVVDEETSQQYEIRARAVINAAGVFSDNLRQLDVPTSPQMISPSQGIHLVVDQRFLGGNDAIMIPKTQDGRVLFAIPWLGRAVLGTTDTPTDTATLEPHAFDDEVRYLLEHFAEYFDPAPTRRDVLSVFAGLRPLVKPISDRGATSKISREHRILTSESGFISVLGGKWTTYRKMAEEVIDIAEDVAKLTARASQTRDMAIEDDLDVLPDDETAPGEQQIVNAVTHEFARSVEDVLARRFRTLLLDARQSIDLAPTVAKVMAQQFGRGPDWIEDQIRRYRLTAKAYLLDEVDV